MKKKPLAMAAAIALLGTSAASAGLVTYIGSDSLGLSASVIFETRSAEPGKLFVTLTNTGGEVRNPSQVLTALFFSLAPELTPVAARLGAGSTVLFGPDGGGDVGGEWAYATGLKVAPDGADSGISSSGLGLFRPRDRFDTTVVSNLLGPASVGGVQYGLVSVNDDPTTGNHAVTGKPNGKGTVNALIQGSVVFTLRGLPSGFEPTALSITNVSFQYGTTLNDPNLVAEVVPPPPDPPAPAVQVPAPGTLLLIGAGLLASMQFRPRPARMAALAR